MVCLWVRVSWVRVRARIHHPHDLAHVSWARGSAYHRSQTLHHLSRRHAMK